MEELRGLGVAKEGCVASEEKWCLPNLTSHAKDEQSEVRKEGTTNVTCELTGIPYHDQVLVPMSASFTC
jgi:hypothetical protein